MSSVIELPKPQNGWRTVLAQEFEKAYFKDLEGALREEYTKEIIFPRVQDVFQALNATDFESTRVVILGQDPYHGVGQAHGYSFSVKEGVDLPPSLKNIFKELIADIGCEMPNHGDLSHWTRQGVLLLNSVLTVRAHSAHSHRGLGWETFTDQIITALARREAPVVFILWGKPAQAKERLIRGNQHLILKARHPSPLSAHRGFFGSRPFSKTNDFLESIGERPIKW